MKRFTLLELLLVVATIGILLTLLLPSLRQARAKSEKAVCMSNFKQVGVALQLHLKDNNYKFPSMLTGNHRYGWLGKKGSGGIYSQLPSKRQLNDYLLEQPADDDAEVPVAHCPSDLLYYEKKGATYGANTGATMPKTLFENNNRFKDSKSFWDVKSPDRFTVMLEDPAITKLKGNNLDGNDYFHTDVGNDRWHLLFTDGAVRFLLLKAGRYNTTEYTTRRDR